MTRTQPGHAHPVPEAVLERAAFALVAGEVVAIPTDTVYGLAANPRRAGATAELFALKGRPPSLELPVLVSGLDQAEHLAEGGMSGMARRVTARFWPGAVTIVVCRRAGLDWELGGDPATIGLRCPAHPFASRLCDKVGPLATTSANPHGKPPLSSSEAVSEEFGDRVGLIVDGGTLAGSPSTVVDLTGEAVRCLREGAVPFGEIEAEASA